MKKYLVVGLGRFGKSVAETLYKKGAIVLALDKNANKIQEMIDNELISDAVTGDSTEDIVLKNIDAKGFDVAFICIGSDLQSSILTVINLKELGVKKIIAKATNLKHGRVLKNSGVTQVVYPEISMGYRLARKEVEPHILDEYHFSSNSIIMELEAPQSFVGKAILKLDFRQKYKGNIIAIKRGKDIDTNITAKTKILENDILILIINKEDAKNLKEIFS